VAISRVIEMQAVLARGPHDTLRELSKTTVADLATSAEPRGEGGGETLQHCEVVTVSLIGLRGMGRKKVSAVQVGAML